MARMYWAQTHFMSWVPLCWGKVEGGKTAEGGEEIAFVNRVVDFLVEHVRTTGSQKYSEIRSTYLFKCCIPRINLPILPHRREGVGVPVVDESGYHVIVGVEQEGGQLGLGADPAGQDHGLVGDKLKNLITMVQRLKG